jgi:hypothetical protein
MKGRLVSTKDLLPKHREVMYCLLCKHFNGVRRDVFNRDLEQKNWVILLEEVEGDIATLQGFSTISIYETEFEGEVLSVVYSGDTIVDPAAWSSSTLARTWVSAVSQLRRQYSKGKLYWLLICSGYRTYRFLPIFCKDFYPRHDLTTPPKTQRLMNFLAIARFGNLYNQDTGVVNFPEPYSLSDGLNGIPEERLGDRHIQFFGWKNPGHRWGDNLVCLTEVVEHNLTSAGQRIWRTESLSVMAHVTELVSV